MADIVPPTPAQIGEHALIKWHQVFKTPWSTLVAIDYVDGAVHRPWTNRIDNLAANDGESALFGEAVLAPELQQSTPSSNINFYAVSTNAADTAVLVCHMVDENDDETVEEITLTGTTPVLIGSYIHCNMGEYAGTNLGNIFVSATNGGGGGLTINADRIQIHVAPGNGHGNNPTQRCPNGQVMVFGGIDMTVDRADGVDFKVYQDREVSGTRACMMIRGWTLFDNALSVDHVTPDAIFAGQEIRMTAQRSAAGTGSVTARANWDQVIYNSESATPATQSGVSALFEY